MTAIHIQLGNSGDGDGTQTKAEANYRLSEDTKQRCGTCVHFDGDHSCEVVSGRISEDHVSDNWEGDTGAQGDGEESAGADGVRDSSPNPGGNRRAPRYQ